MISEFMLDIVFNIVSGMFSMLPEVSWSVDSSAFEFLLSFIRCIAYLLPWGTVTSIVGVILALSIFRIVIAIIKAVWDLLPFA